VAALIVREALWSALSGLETAYHDLAWALEDFCQRAAAIGFAVDGMPIAARGSGADAVFFRRRAAAAPPRVPAVGTETLPSRAGSTVYTAITDSYDTLKLQPPESIGDWRQVAFLDVCSRSALGSRLNGWTAADIGAIGGSDLSDPHRISRFPKINAHLALPDATFSLWVDASIGIVAPLPLGRLVDLFLGDSDICVFRHGQQQTVEEEAEICKWFGLDRPETIDAQMGRYRAAGFPDEEPLAELPVILRRHSPAMRAFNEAWWTEVVNGSRRDQLSFNYVAWKLGVRYATFPLSVAAGNGLFLKFRRSSLDPTV
jgi:hypothetical protein